MPSFQDSALIFFIALLLFGPKKLPELARQLGKLMGEFRRASNEFRMQMEDELRLAEQTEQQKKIAAMQAAAPVVASVSDANSIADPDRQDTLASEVAPALEAAATPEPVLAAEASVTAQTAAAPLPIATSGDLNLMPPPTGLPAGRSSLATLLDAVPHAPEPEPPCSTDDFAAQQLPDRKTTHDTGTLTNEVPLHG